MPRNFLMIDQSEIDARIAENIRSRELELLSYDFERANHEAAITRLGDIKWDAATTKYKGLARDAMIVLAMKDGLDSETIQKISDLNALESHKLNLEAVKAETTKSERFYENLLAALPDGERRTAAISEIQSRETVAK